MPRQCAGVFPVVIDLYSTNEIELWSLPCDACIVVAL